MSRIFVTGDTHGVLDLDKLRKLPVDKFTKEDYVIICGDAGIIWGSNTDEEIIELYNSLPFTTLFVDGNHENHDLLDSYPVEEWNGGKVHKISDSIIHLMRGQVFNICGRSFFTMGGAESTDKWHRTEGVSWWRREMPSTEEYNEAMENLEKVGFKVDYVLTHCAPISILWELGHGFRWYEKDALTGFFNRLVYDFDLKFKTWYFGHYHVDRGIKEENEYKYVCLYDCVERII